MSGCREAFTKGVLRDWLHRCSAIQKCWQASHPQCTSNKAMPSPENQQLSQGALWMDGPCPEST